MALAIPVSNPGTNGSNMRYWVGPGSGLTRGERGWTDGTYWYDDNGLSLDRPDSPLAGLAPANESERYDVYSGRGRIPPQAAPPPQQHDLSGDVVPPADVAEARGRVPDAQNPAAVQYALRRLAQLRALGFDFDIIDDDPAATWRNASLGVVEAARAAGYDNPRDWLAGRPKPGPRPAAGFYDEGDTVAPPASTPRRASRPSAAKVASKVVRRPPAKSRAKTVKAAVLAGKGHQLPRRPKPRPKINIRKAAAKAQPFRRDR